MQNIDNRVSIPNNNDFMVHNYRMENDPKYAAMYRFNQATSNQALEDRSFDVVGLGSVSNAARKTVGRAVAPSRQFSKGVLNDYSEMYDYSKKYGQANTLYWPPNEKHYNELVDKFTNPESVAALNKHYQKTNDTFTLAEKLEDVKKLPDEEGLGRIDTMKKMMMASPTDQEIWSGMQTRKNWKLQ